MIKGSTLCRIACGMAGGALIAAGIARRYRRISFAGASIVITGGSRGLGLEMARLLAAEGARLSLIARNVDELEKAGLELEKQGGDVQVYTCDVTNVNEVERTVKDIVKARGSIEVLINNAGIVQVAPFENMELEDFRKAMDVHTWGPLYMMMAVVPQLKRQGRGRIVNISSIGGLVAIPHLLPYCMSKFALTGLSDGLRAELRKDGILVTTVAPGLMRTGSHINAFFRGQHRKEFAWFALSAGNPLFSANSRRAARQIIEACRYGEPRLIITLPAALLHLINANLPALTAAVTALGARLLPQAVPVGSGLRTGAESSSFVSPSILTRLGDQASRRNNEI